MVIRMISCYIPRCVGAGPEQPGGADDEGRQRMKSLDRITPDAGVAMQYAALCYRRGGKGKIEVLLITSRDTGRWVIPKGWPIPGSDAPGGAAQEAWEEAGVKGTVAGPCIGLYSYDKVADGGRLMPTVVAVFPIRVAKLAGRWPEKGDRKRKWFSPAKAATKVAEPELAALIAGFEPAALSAEAGGGADAATAARQG